MPPYYYCTSALDIEKLAIIACEVNKHLVVGCSVLLAAEFSAVELERSLRGRVLFSETLDP